MNKAIEEFLESFKSFSDFILLLFCRKQLIDKISIDYFKQSRLDLYAKLVYSSIFLLVTSSINQYINAKSILTYNPDVKQLNLLDHFLSMSFSSLVPAVALFIIALEIILSVVAKSNHHINFALSYILIFISCINIIISLTALILCLVALGVHAFLPYLMGHVVANTIYLITVVSCIIFISNRYTLIKNRLKIKSAQLNFLAICSYLLFSFLIGIFSENKDTIKQGRSVNFLNKQQYAILLADSISPNYFKLSSEIIFENQNSENYILPQDTIHFNLYVSSYEPGFFSQYRIDTVKFISVNDQKLLSYKKEEPCLIKLQSGIDSVQIRKIIPSYKNYAYHLALDVETLNLGKAPVFSFNTLPRFIEGNNFIADRFCCTEE